MEAFILESLVGTQWRRGGQTFWTLESARNEGERMVKRKLAHRIRILVASVAPDAIAEIPTMSSTNVAN
jgi:hypothetical protein